VKINLWRDGKILKSTRGDILFTHHNLSGPGIIDFSRYILKDDTLGINFLKMGGEEFGKELLESANKNGKQSIKNFLLQYTLPERFIKKLLNLWGIDEMKKLSEISKADRTLLIQLADYKMRVTRLGGMEIAMATSGGISLDEINPKTMESRVLKNLYFAGEVMDIDGDTGGFNIQAAFSTGYLAGKSILKKLKSE
ncbi:MAG: NAD(P)/FAD-dependent oxidoreductase, partial [Fusobacteriaceae bacterium]